ncbi:MAG: gliding motility-associated C-terminal domain-containing protein, partial [Bacteroidetes bacterium]|nr:gliding motility-associated C-terminal domain-containing protein [Bacteroidota bacterium]
HFGNNTDVAQDFIWYFDWPNLTPSATGTTATYTYPDTGTYTIALVAEPVGQCVDTGYHTIYLQNNSLTPDFTWQTYDCTSQSELVLQDLSVDNVSPVVEWFWEVNFGPPPLTSTLQNPVFLIPNPSSGTITLTARSVNGCEQTKTLDFVSGNNYPVDSLPDIVPICLGETAHLNPAGAVDSFTYNWGPPVPVAQQNLANPAVVPTQSTIYTVTITSYNGLCQSTGKVTVQVFQPTQLEFVPDTDCDSKVVHFVNQSQNAPSGFAWVFGDPTTTADVSTEANPTYVYPAYGTYTVTLMTAPNAVCKDTIQQDITLAEKILLPAFTYGYTNCEEDAVSIKFFDQTINDQGNTTGWLWTFSGVYTGTSTLANPTITVAQQGTLYATLQVATEENCLAASALDSLEIDFTELPNLEDGSEVLGCLNGGVVLNPGGATGYQYQWSPATGLSCTDCPSPLANPSQTTTYTVTVSNLSADTCDITRQVTVIVPPNVNVVASADVLTCDPATTLTASVGLLPVTYAWFDENGNQVAGNVTSITVNVSGYDYYVVRATDQLGCHYYDTVYVAGGPANIEAMGDQIKCSNEPLDVYATNLDGNDTLTWQWSPGTIFNGPTNVPNPDVLIVPGEQWVYVDAVNQFGCIAHDSVYVAVVDVNNTFDFDFVVGCNGSTVQFNNLSINAFNFSWNFGDSTTLADTSYLDHPIYTYPGPGTYPVRLTMDFDLACVDTLVRNIEILETQYVVDFTYEYQACDVDSVDVQFHDATTILQAGITIDSFHWETNTGETADVPSPVFRIYSGQTFEVTLTIFTSNDCDGTITKDLKLEFIEINFSDSVVLCPGDSTALNPFGNLTYEYHWMPNIAISDPNVANPTVWPSQTTTYFVEITNFSPDTCSVTRTVMVFVPEKIEVTAPADTLTCGTPITVCAQSNLQPIDYEWIANPGGLVGEDACLTILPSADTEYEVIGTDQYGCKDSDTFNIAEESVKVNWQNAGAECPETEVQLTVNNLVPDHNLSYLWTATAPGQILPPGTGPTVTVLTPPASQTASYSVSVTNQFGCTDEMLQSITGFGFVPTVVQDVEVCPGVGEPLNPGANPNLNYLWSPPGGLSSTTVPNPMVTVLQSTTYTVTVSDNFGPDECQEVIEVDVFAAPIIDIDETVDTFTCGTPITISSDVNVPVTLEWHNSAGQPLGSGPTIQVDPLIADVYKISVIDAYGCTASDEVAVSNNQLDIVLDGNGVIDTCPMPSYNICVTNLDPNDFPTYEWTASNGGTILGGGDTACPDVTTPQGVVSNFEVTVTNQWGCSDTADFEVETYTFNPLIRDLTTICPGVPTPINPEAEGSELSYFWSPQVGLDCYDCPNPEATLNASQFYQVTVQGYNEGDTCSITQTVQVRVNEPIGLTTNPTDTSLCDSTDVLLSSTYTSTIVTGLAWSLSLDFSNPFSTFNDVVVIPQGTQVYYVLATDTLGCRDTASVTVNAFPVSISLDDIFSFCEEIGTLTIGITNNVPSQVMQYIWSPMEYIDQVQADGSIIVSGLTENTVFTVQAINQPYGCSATDSAAVNYYDIEPTLGQISSSMDTILLGSGEFSQLEIDLLHGYTYEWAPAEGLDDPTIHNPIAMPETTTTYTVLVTDEGGCQAIRQVKVEVYNPDCDEPNLFLPKAFTPNGDGENDVLYFRGNIIDEMELAIYNRWGQKVFETTDKNTGWDGTFKNELLTPDVYGYYLKAKCYNGQEFFKKGNVTLLR